VSTRRSQKRLCESIKTPINIWLKPQSIADMLGLSLEVLQSWRMTDAGPPYIKLSASNSGRVRYQRDRVLSWQRSVQRVVPDNWPSNESDAEIDSDKPLEWFQPKKAAMALGIAIPTLTAWRRRHIGVPFIFIGGGGVHEFMYDRRDIEVFISRRRADPSLIPVITKKIYGKDPRMVDERTRMNAQIWKDMGHSDEEIRRCLKK
jgi:hypothetical protein